MNTNNDFSAADLDKINIADDLKIAPFRADDVTYGTPTWIWNVVVDNQLYVRAYNGKQSRWYQSAVQQKAGRIHAAGRVKEVTFETVEDAILNERIDLAYKEKYSESQYLPPMVSPRAKAATVRITQKAEK